MNICVLLRAKRDIDLFLWEQVYAALRNNPQEDLIRSTALFRAGYEKAREMLVALENGVTPLELSLLEEKYGRGDRGNR